MEKTSALNFCFRGSPIRFFTSFTPPYLVEPYFRLCRIKEIIGFFTQTEFPANFKGFHINIDSRNSFEIARLHLLRRLRRSSLPLAVFVLRTSPCQAGSLVCTCGLPRRNLKSAAWRRLCRNEFSDMLQRHRLFRGHQKQWRF